MKNILLISSGLSPQVITESLYYFNHSKNPIKIDEVHVITDSIGSKLIKNNLFTGPGWFHQYLKDYEIDKNAITFNMGNVHILLDQNGIPLKDLLTVEDNSAAVSQIFNIVEKLTEDSNNRIIANIAGGRKTMSVILGQAMQFYANQHDLLTHVIIEEKYLRLIDFFYPPPNEIEKNINGKNVDLSKIKIFVNELPFVRLKPVLGNLLTHIKGKNLYDLVSIAQKHLSELLKPISIKFRNDSKIDINQHTIILQKKDLAVYRSFLSLIENGYREDGKDVGFISADNIIETFFLEIYLEHYTSYYPKNNIYVQKELERINNKKDRQKFFTSPWFRQTRSKINKALKKQLPPHLYAVCRCISSGKYGDTSYGIPLKKNQLIISNV